MPDFANIGNPAQRKQNIGYNVAPEHKLVQKLNIPAWTLLYGCLTRAVWSELTEKAYFCILFILYEPSSEFLYHRTH